MRGESTIPDYGKNNFEAQKYLIPLVYQTAFAEIFLELIAQTTAYRYDVKHDKIPAGRKVVLTDCLLKELSDISLRLSEEIKRHRLIIMETTRALNKKHKNLNIELEYQNTELADPNLPNFQADFQEDTALAQKYFDKILDILEDCIQSLKNLNFENFKNHP